MGLRLWDVCPGCQLLGLGVDVLFLTGGAVIIK
jgi:hypothetical protein